MTSLPQHHPFRARVIAELHARPFSPLAVDKRLLHFAFLVTAEQAEADRAAILELAAGLRDTFALANERYLLLDDGRLRWERHGEFITYTFEVTADAVAGWPGHLAAPGLLLVAVDLHLAREGGAPGAHVQAEIVGGAAAITSNFEANNAGFVEIAVSNRSLSDDMAGATVQRILELETYRCFALLGLPVAELSARMIGEIEAGLPPLIERMDAASSLEDNQTLLDQLTQMTLALERSSAETHFRFGATRAYAELVRLRLRALGEDSSPGNTGLTSFFSRRFEPAIRFCATLADREANLARKLTRAGQLLRTRVEISLQSQNRDLLEATANRISLQLRLQRTVEGLSIAAVAYYVTGLLHYVVDGLAVHWRIDSAKLLAACVPGVILAVGAGMWRIRQGHIEPGSLAEER